ncbi:brp Blh family beta-carotene 15,15-monooxygenase [Amylolactobacillus amylotrophicus DSM 20534]|nr:brp Blh family beta-carotene 15,15-monooxygenase [Amylolactobacillus amylotrophicus DSM 20534]KRM42655.1 brp Blh family beta-carotene 15,15-monooxygenase [Amylolactobacillus amylophilus DSM 20533 = JCM 1125]
MVPGTIKRLCFQVGINNSTLIINGVRYLLILCLMTILFFSVWSKFGKQQKKNLNLRFINVLFLLLLIFQIVGGISGQGLWIRITGYFLFVIALIILCFSLKDSTFFFSPTVMNTTIICYALINGLLGIAQYLTGSSIISVINDSGISNVSSSQLDNVQILGILAWNGGQRAFGFLDSGMILGVLLVTAFGILYYDGIPANKHLKFFLECIYVFAIVATLTRNVYFLFLLMLLSKFVIKNGKLVFLFGLFVQILPIVYVNSFNTFSFLQSSFFGTLKSRLDGILFFENFYPSSTIRILFGNGYQFDNSFKLITAYVVDNQGLALYLDIGLFGTILVYYIFYTLLAHASVTKINSAMYSMIMIFPFFGLANNHLVFFSGLLVLLVMSSKYDADSIEREKIQFNKDFRKPTIDFP